jgi:hypothetical protein
MDVQNSFLIKSVLQHSGKFTTLFQKVHISSLFFSKPDFITKNKKGLNIIRMGDGTTRKVVVK